MYTSVQGPKSPKPLQEGDGKGRTCISETAQANHLPPSPPPSVLVTLRTPPQATAAQRKILDSKAENPVVKPWLAKNQKFQQSWNEMLCSGLCDTEQLSPANVKTERGDALFTRYRVRAPSRAGLPRTRLSSSLLSTETEDAGRGPAGFTRTTTHNRPTCNRAVHN